MPQAALPQAKRRRIEELGRQGKKRYEIVKAVGVAEGTVTKILREAGIKSSKATETERNLNRVHDEVKKGGSFTEVAKRANVSPRAACDIAKREKPKEPPQFCDDFPDPLDLSYDAYEITTPGQWGVIGDIHLPCHDRTTVELFVKECRRRKVVGVVLNGDILDSHEVSDHLRDPSAIRYCDEIELGKQLLSWLRKQLPKIQIVYKHGNHETRVFRYLLGRAPAIEGLEGVSIRDWLHFKDFGIEEVKDDRVIHLGKLNIIHGHEYRGGGGVNPARWLYLRARSVALTNHFHRTSEHHDRNINMRYEAAWSLGCACYLHPAYMRINNWNHGCGFADVANDGSFSFENKRVFEGRII